MKIDHQQLTALLGVIREGSFERAAQILCVTPSAISQRIRNLEESLGTLLVIRETPCRPTEEGEKLYRHALQLELLEQDFFKSRGDKDEGHFKGHFRLSVAVNADSLATWFYEAISLFHQTTGFYIEAVVDDQDNTEEWLRQGRVVAAVTSQSKPIQGCRAEPLGAMRYTAMASPAFIEKYFSEGLTAESLAQAPMLNFGPKDRLQINFVGQSLGITLDQSPPCHIIPSSHVFQDAAAAGLGWGVAPVKLLAPYLASGQLIDIAPGKSISVPLYWQAWRLTSPQLEALTKAVRQGFLSVDKP